MATAKVHIPEVGGFAGRARCFKITPAFEGHDYVTVWVQPGYGAFQRPEAAAVPATESGACAEHSLMRRPGSYVLHAQVETDEQFDGACWLALQMLGGYQVVT
ncbi:hypothetical protein [Nocardia wallacei]|uniref:hypothetical protein n=1 Tax=Nocardia wallacei TaxID=480035 RepID=UPI002454B63C|nr:hypothetical protein [Nocardia wallacei]